MRAEQPSRADGFRADLQRTLRVPVVAAPMFLVSGPDLVIAACNAGVIGSFPTLNARTSAILDEWLGRITQETRGSAPFAANLILDKSNQRLEEDLALVQAHRVPLVIASVGRPDRVVEPVHGYGGRVLADVATLRHARNAVSAGVDGLVLLTAGAGGNTGSVNPFAFVAAVREFFDGPVAVAGCISSGWELRALQLLGADLGYMGTAFLATQESMAPNAHKQAVVEAGIDDIVLTDRLSGLPANFIRSRLQQAGVMDLQGRITAADNGTAVASWKEVWSAGHGVGAVKAVHTVRCVVDRLLRGYHAEYGAEPGGEGR